MNENRLFMRSIENRCERYAIRSDVASRRGFEPPIYRLGGGCVIHCATET